MMAEISVYVVGPTGSGKSSVASEIDIALRAIGVRTTWVDADAERGSVPLDRLDPGAIAGLTVTILELGTASIPEGSFGGPTLTKSRDTN